MVKVNRALISVWDKTGIVEFAQELDRMGVEIISTGGTAKMLSQAGIVVKEVSQLTGFPEMLEGRVKTLHPAIHGAILALREKEDHMRQLKEKNIAPIDMVVVNLYPFAQTVAKEGVTLEEVLENIDIGGPSMIRSAAKNFLSVAVVTHPTQYQEVLAELKDNNGCLSLERRRELAVEAFRCTSRYDEMIYRYLEGKEPEAFPEKLSLEFVKLMDLRYGENAHQRAAFYKDLALQGPCIANAIQLQGKALSFNNIYDFDAALELVREFEEPAVAIIKHTNPCGAAVAETICQAYQRAYQADPVSAFGGIIALNKPMDRETAEGISQAHYDGIIAPDYSHDALAVLGKKKDLILLKTGNLTKVTAESAISLYDMKKVVGGLLVQESDDKVLDEDKLVTVTQRAPEERELEDLIFAWKVVKYVKSNAIVVAKDKMTLGIGAGQMNRVGAAEIAVAQAGEKAGGAVLASDGMIPFRDTVDVAAAAGIRAIIQPGGSVKDKECIAAADEHNIAMVFTGLRHFRH